MDYRFRLKLYQVAAGDENAKVRISHGDTVLVESVDIVSTDGFAPSTVEFDVTDLAAPAADTSVTFKIELLNDALIDGVTDRDVGITRVFYIPKQIGFAEYSCPAELQGPPEAKLATIKNLLLTSDMDESEFWFEATDDMTRIGGEAQATDWATRDWIKILESNVEVNVKLTKTWGTVLDEVGIFIIHENIGNYTILD